MCRPFNFAASLPRPAMMAWNAIGDVVIGLLVDGENCHLRLKTRGIVQGPNFDDKGARARRAAGADGGAACATEKAGHRPLQIAAREARRCANRSPAGHSR